MKKDRKQTHTQTDGHRDSMKESAKGRFFENFFKKIGQSGGASQWRVCYQRGLPRLVFKESALGRFFHRVAMSVYVFICLSPFHVLHFEAYFAPTSRSRMTNIFRDSESLGKSAGKKWSQN